MKYLFGFLLFVSLYFCGCAANTNNQSHNFNQEEYIWENFIFSE